MDALKLQSMGKVFQAQRSDAVAGVNDYAVGTIELYAPDKYVDAILHWAVMDSVQLAQVRKAAHAHAECYTGISKPVEQIHALFRSLVKQS